MIGICAVRERARWAFWDQHAHLVADTYVASVQRAGGIAVLLPIDVGAADALVGRIDGLLLIGGADVDPASYGAERHLAWMAKWLKGPHLTPSWQLHKIIH